MQRGADPIWSGFSDVHADWHYEDITDSSATMDVSCRVHQICCNRTSIIDTTPQVPMVRGSAILTHLYSNANPLVVPLCLASINGNPVTYQCPAENPSKLLPKLLDYLEDA